MADNKVAQQELSQMLVLSYLWVRSLNSWLEKLKSGLKPWEDCKSNLGKYMIEKQRVCVSEKKKMLVDTHSQLLDHLEEFIT